MSPGLLPYTVEVVERADTVTGRAGLPLVLETLRALGLDQAIADHVHVRERQSGYSETAKVEAVVLLLAAGGDCFDDIEPLLLHPPDDDCGGPRHAAVEGGETVLEPFGDKLLLEVLGDVGRL